MIIAIAQLAVGLGLSWQAVRPGIWQRELRMADDGPLSVVRAIVLRIDPAQLRFSLDTATREERTRGAWTVERIPPAGVIAFNAGQFTGGMAWGWLVRDGVERQEPGRGSLSMSFVVDSSGKVALVSPDELPTFRGHVAVAFQSYPALLTGSGEQPWELLAPGRGVNLGHRDSRLALGVLADGSVLIALTRYDGLGGAAETLPWGPTVGEMAAFMKSLGCRRAVLLDGGLSSQLAVRRLDGSLRSWTNWRAVPLGLVVSAKSAAMASERQ